MTAAAESRQTLAGRSVLSARQKQVFFAIAEAMLSDELPGGELVAPSASAVTRMVEEMDWLIGSGSSDLHRGFAVLSFLIDWLPLFFIGALSRATRLPLSSRVRYLQSLERSRYGIFATLLVAMKLPISLVAFEEETLLAKTGFDRSTISARRRLPVREG